MASLDLHRVRLVITKELLDYRRKRAILVTMLILPALFLIEPIVSIFLVPAAAPGPVLDRRLTLALLYLLLIPVVMPSTLAAYCVAGEREQGTLEPLLTTPVRRQEFILGKAGAVLIPTITLSYTAFGLFLAAVRLFATAAVGSAVFHQGPVLLALFLFAPVVAGWGIVVGMAVSVRAGDVRVAQQLGMVASLPVLGVVVMLVAGVIHPTITVALSLAAGLLAADLLALRAVSSLFDRERLVTGAKATAPGKGGRIGEPQGAGLTIPPALAGQPTPGSATLTVTRKWGGLLDRNRDWQIEVDGNVVGSIASRSTVSLSVPAGGHTVRLRANRHHSPSRAFDAEAGQVVHFWCRAAMSWPQYVAALVKPDLWISLRRD